MIEHDGWSRKDKEVHAIRESQRMAWHERKYVEIKLESWHDYALRFEAWLIRYLEQEAV